MQRCVGKNKITRMEATKCYALLMHSKCLSLQIICFTGHDLEFAWQMITDSKGEVRIKLMEGAERRAVDLFSIRQHNIDY